MPDGKNYINSRLQLARWFCNLGLVKRIGAWHTLCYAAPCEGDLCQFLSFGSVAPQ
jgi:hypothetical protein